MGALMFSTLFKALAPWRWWAIAGAVTACIGLAGAAYFTMRADTYKAAAGDAAQAINTKGIKDADAVAKGEFAVRECRSSGRVWDLARGRCVER